MDNNINITENIYNIEKEVKCLEDSILKIEENYNIQNIKISNLEIENINLKEENKILKIKINNLEIDNKKKDEEIRELKEDNKILKIKINNLEIDNKKKDEEIRELKEDNKNLKIKFLINKIYEALTDIINEDNLEVKIDKYYNELIKLKENRNNICHYIKKRDIRDVKYKKIELLLFKLENLEDEIKEIINENILDVLDTDKEIDIIEEIANYYKINKIIINSNNISSKDLKSIENWWKY
jgi:hypothetical protein